MSSRPRRKPPSRDPRGAGTPPGIAVLGQDSERVEETLSGYTAAVAISVLRARPVDTLDAEAQRVARLLGSVPVPRTMHIEAPPSTPESPFRLARGAGALGPCTCGRSCSTPRKPPSKGTEAGQVQEGATGCSMSAWCSHLRRNGAAWPTCERCASARRGAMVRLDQVAGGITPVRAATPCCAQRRAPGADHHCQRGGPRRWPLCGRRRKH